MFWYPWSLLCYHRTKTPELTANQWGQETSNSMKPILRSIIYRRGQYRRSGNFRVKYISPFNFSHCFIFVAQAHQRKLNHVKILFTRTRSAYMELPLATYLERFHPFVLVRGSNCLQKFASMIVRLGSAIFQDREHH